MQPNQALALVPLPRELSEVLETPEAQRQPGSPPEEFATTIAQVHVRLTEGLIEGRVKNVYNSAKYP